MSNVSYIKIFNHLIDEFFKELIELFPENNAIKVRHSLFETVVKLNVKKTCNDFMTKIIPYLEKVANRDNEFFLGEGAPDIINTLQFNKQDLEQLSDTTKNALWKYIKSFITIGFKIIEMPQETHAIINYIINN